MKHKTNRGKSTTKHPEVKSVNIRNKKKILNLPRLPPKPRSPTIRNVSGEIQC